MGGVGLANTEKGEGEVGMVRRDAVNTSGPGYSGTSQITLGSMASSDLGYQDLRLSMWVN